MKEGRIDFFAKLVIAVLGVCVFGYFFIGRVLVLLLPFLLAWLVAFAARPIAEKLSGKLRLPLRFVRLAVAVLGLVGLISLLLFAVWRLLLQGWHILSSLGENSEMTALIERLMNPESMLARVLPDSVAEGLSRGIDSAIDGLISAFADVARGFVTRVPEIFLFVIITLIATVYFALDLERINAFVRERLPARAFFWLIRFKDGFLTVGARYVRAYLLIMLIVFSVTLAGLLLLGAEYAFLVAAIAAVLDVLPAIGIGTVLVPWGVFEILLGSRPFGVGLIVLFLAVELIRQLIEPRIVGKNLGLHPVVSLFLIWSAYSLFGFFGVITVPVLAVTVNALFGKNDPPKVKKLAPKEADGA